jgi:transcriptional regulator with XRE-family HTH domain
MVRGQDTAWSGSYHGAAMPAKPVQDHLMKHKFGNRLAKLMRDKNWTQSELARHSDLPRDSISTYIRGKVLPTALSLKKLAQALGTTPETLLPHYIERSMNSDDPPFEIRASPEDPSKAWLKVNKLVKNDPARTIWQQLLQADDADTTARDD